MAEYTEFDLQLLDLMRIHGVEDDRRANKAGDFTLAQVKTITHGIYNDGYPKVFSHYSGVHARMLVLAHLLHKKEEAPMQ